MDVALVAGVGRSPDDVGAVAPGVAVPDTGRFDATVAGAWLDCSAGWEPVVVASVAGVAGVGPVRRLGSLGSSVADWASSPPPHAAVSMMIPAMSAVLRTRWMGSLKAFGARGDVHGVTPLESECEKLFQALAPVA